MKTGVINVNIEWVPKKTAHWSFDQQILFKYSCNQILDKIQMSNCWYRDCWMNFQLNQSMIETRF